MNTYTAIYSTESIKNIQYSFTLETDDEAISYANCKFRSIDGITLIRNTKEGNAVTGCVIYRNGARTITSD